MPGRFRLELGASPPYFELVGSDGASKFDSRDKLFRCTDVLQGSRTFASRATPRNEVNVYSVGSCNANATHVLGYMRTTSTSFGTVSLNPFPDTGEWFAMQGTFVGWCSANGSGSDAAAYTFLASAGAVTLEEQLAIYVIRNEFGQTFQFGGFTLEWELWVGTFI